MYIADVDAEWMYKKKKLYGYALRSGNRCRSIRMNTSLTMQYGLGSYWKQSLKVMFGRETTTEKKTPNVT